MSEGGGPLPAQVILVLRITGHEARVERMTSWCYFTVVLEQSTFAPSDPNNRFLSVSQLTRDVLTLSCSRPLFDDRRHLHSNFLTTLPEGIFRTLTALTFL